MHVVFIECILRTQVVQTQFNYSYDDLCEEKIAEMDKYIGYKDQSKNENIFKKLKSYWSCHHTNLWHDMVKFEKESRKCFKSSFICIICIANIPPYLTTRSSTIVTQMTL